ncbi:tetratricopeptide repeat protein [Terasakiella sp. A23]|uniref:tetratricopeptide repeat protein n=1 Tax=Terasakiella sp. FCG-A23 TaxID=3080561 RepID=UPI002953392C|nr:tetratricopeptide repeat protein [Terasakiella sp. A23]MDV7339729.1 tetratricopeptide repeat protein [Terasakiella sp. A23]
MQNVSLDQALQIAMQQINSGQLGQAQNVLNQILSKVPSHPDARHLLGVTYLSQGKYADAETEIRKSIKKNPKFPMAHYNLGNALLGLDKSDQAINAFKKSLKLKPDYLQAERRLADAYYIAERFDEAEKTYRDVMAKVPQDVNIVVTLADMLDTQGKWEAAIELYRKAISMKPDEAVLHTKLANTLNQDSQHEEAEKVIKKALELDPDHHSTHMAHSYIMLSQKKPDAGLAAAEKALEIFPGETTAVAWKLAALDQLGGGDEYDRYMDFDTFVKPEWVDVPDGYKDIDEFNEALVQHVENHPKLFSFDHYEVTRYGKEVKDIYSEPMGPVAHLKAAMEKHVAGYIASLPDDPDNQFVATAPKKWRIKSWANILAGPGRQIAHIHGEAWMSGCYYVRLPDVMKGEENPDHAGYIEFGQINDEFPMLETDRLKFLQPKEGLVALFPSYLYHSTVPTESQQPRIAIAFDVVPVS